MKGLLRVLLWITIFTGLVIGLARLTAIRWLRLPTDDPIFTTSLIPTLFPGDLIVTWRLAEPVFGDLVLCPEPDYPERIVIGRIVGMEGDSVTFDNGRPKSNGEKFVTERNCIQGTVEYPHPDRPGEIVTQSCSWEALANNLHKVGELGSADIRPEDRQFDVPQDHYFLLSDNRRFPYDSRDYGFVEADSCKEIVFARIVSREGWADSERRLDYIH